MEWMDQAVCKQVDPELFVGDGPSHILYQRHQRAIEICKTCPVIFQCRDYALNLARESVIFGVWGGLSAREINARARGHRSGQVA